MTDHQFDVICFLAVVLLVALILGSVLYYRTTLYPQYFKMPDDIQRMEERLDRLEAKLSEVKHDN